MDGEFSSALVSSRVCEYGTVMRVLTNWRAVSFCAGRTVEHRGHSSRSQECSMFLASASG